MDKIDRLEIEAKAASRVMSLRAFKATYKPDIHPDLRTVAVYEYLAAGAPHSTIKAYTREAYPLFQRTGNKRAAKLVARHGRKIVNLWAIGS